ncbi:hypothetical protein BpHYR1_005149 [Brachionus plicatilis]|uniref:Uncharacterized protein n=1 Tax=Brachionus plicatilis TaxID=10195 RepID=A0A3M7SNT7_BRAPC|nr:hypothetical protein BpHYR1_005149 [Brachionus plicatilis]
MKKECVHYKIQLSVMIFFKIRHSSKACQSMKSEIIMNSSIAHFEGRGINFLIFFPRVQSRIETIRITFRSLLLVIRQKKFQNRLYVLYLEIICKMNSLTYKFNIRKLVLYLSFKYVALEKKQQ